VRRGRQRFGNRAAILSISDDGKFLTAVGPRLIVPGDAGSARDLRHVAMVTTRRANPQLPISGCPSTANLFTPSVPSLVVNGDVRTPQTLAFSQLQGMTQVGQTVSFLSGSTPTTASKSGPTLADVLAKAAREIDPSLRNRNPLVSLVENGGSLANAGPRVVQSGDVRGGGLGHGGGLRLPRRTANPGRRLLAVEQVVDEADDRPRGLEPGEQRRLARRPGGTDVVELCLEPADEGDEHGALCDDERLDVRPGALAQHDLDRKSERTSRTCSTGRESQARTAARPFGVAP
jgi:hypothetical protein